MEKDMEKLTSLLRNIASASPSLATTTEALMAAAATTAAATSNKKRKISPIPSPVTSVSPEPMAVTSLSEKDDDVCNSKNLEVTAAGVPKVPPMPSPHKLTSSSSTREASFGALSSVDEDFLTTLFPLDDPSSSDVIHVDDDFSLTSDDPVIADAAGADLIDIPLVLPSPISSATAPQDLEYLQES
jgi:hypothetical protein